MPFPERFSPLSEYTSFGLPRLLIKRRKASMQESVDSEAAISMCTHVKFCMYVCLYAYEHTYMQNFMETNKSVRPVAC